MLNKSTEIMQYIRALTIRTKAMHAKRMGYPVTNTCSSNSLIDTEQLNKLLRLASSMQLCHIGDPFNSSTSIKYNVKAIEIKLIQLLGKYFNVDEQVIRGYVTTGGTEGNFAGIWWARKYLNKQSKQMNAKTVFIISDEAHYSLNKISDQMQLDVHTIPTNDKGEIECYKLMQTTLELIRQGTTNFIICLTIGTTKFGAIDNLPQIKRFFSILQESKKISYAIHTDAALVGPVIPVIQPFGKINSIFDYTDSLSFSGHKFFGTRTMCGIVLTTKKYLSNAFSDSEKVQYAGGIVDSTVSGSRQGLSIIELFYIFSNLNLEDKQALTAIVQKCLENASLLYHELCNLVGAENVYWNKLFTIIFPKVNCEELLYTKYGLMPISDNQVGTCIMPHVTKTLIKEFIYDYRATRGKNNLRHGLVA